MLEQLFFWPSAFCVNESEIWFVYGKVCVLCKFDINTSNTDIVAEIPVDNMFRESLFRNIIYKNKKIYLIPCWAKNILVYDIDDEIFKSIAIKDFYGLMFSNAYLLNDKIWCTPFSYPGIVCIDTNTDKAEIILDLSKTMKNNGIYYFNDSDYLNGIITMVSPQSNKGFIFNISTKHLDIVDVNKEGIKYDSVAMLPEGCFFSSFEGKCIHILKDSDKTPKKLILPNKSNGVYLSSINQDRLLLDDIKSSCIWVYKDEKCIKKYETEYIENRENYYSYSTGVFDKKSNLYFDNCTASFSILFAEETWRMPIKDFQLKIFEELYVNKMVKYGVVIKESLFSGLRVFITKLLR